MKKQQQKTICIYCTDQDDLFGSRKDSMDEDTPLERGVVYLAVGMSVVTEEYLIIIYKGE